MKQSITSFLCLNIICLWAVFLLPSVTFGDDDHYPKLSPFEAIRFNDDGPEIMLGGNWFDLLAIEGVPIKDLHDFARKQYGDRAQKRFGEDLVQLMEESGHPLSGNTVTILVRSVQGGPEMEFNDVIMTAANRQQIWKSNKEKKDSEKAAKQRDVARSSRQHATDIPDHLSFLTRRFASPDARQTKWLTAEEAAEDLDQLEQALEEQYAYLHRTDVDYRAALDAIRGSLGDGIRVDDFGFQLQMMLGMFGDGHTRISGVNRVFPTDSLPFFIEADGDQFLAVNKDRDGFVDPEYPVLLGIDGFLIDDWMEVARWPQSEGSDPLVNRSALRMATEAGAMRRLLDYEEADSPEGKDWASDVVVLLLGSLGGDSTIEKPVLMSASSLTGNRLDELETIIRDDNIAYLRLERMDEKQVQEIIGLMAASKGTQGLIVDVRGNGGGSRQALKTFHEFIKGDREPPQVINIGAYRLNEAFPKTHLAARSMYRADDPIFSGPERASISHAVPGFEPEMKLPAGQFSPWHYFVLGAGGRAAWAYEYDNPIVVLLDGGSFSATDIFLGAMKDREDVLLVGTTSGGGSGRAQRIKLAHSGLSPRMSSMASFRKRGQLYDGSGVEPDVIVIPEPGDFIGESDRQLETAVELIKNAERWPVPRPRYRPTQP